MEAGEAATGGGFGERRDAVWAADDVEVIGVEGALAFCWCWYDTCMAHGPTVSQLISRP